MIFVENIAAEIWNKLTYGNFYTSLLCVVSLHCKMTPICIHGLKICRIR